MMHCSVHAFDTLGDYAFVVSLVRHAGQWLFCRHAARDTWETAGGHIEPGETPQEAAARELCEETGAVDFTLVPLCDYRAGEDAPDTQRNGQVYLARVRALAALPEGSEMAEVRLFAALPERLTYPAITPHLYARALAVLEAGW